MQGDRDFLFVGDFQCLSSVGLSCLPPNYLLESPKQRPGVLGPLMLDLSKKDTKKGQMELLGRTPLEAGMTGPRRLSRYSRGFDACRP